MALPKFSQKAGERIKSKRENKEKEKAGERIGREKMLNFGSGFDEIPLPSFPTECCVSECRVLLKKKKKGNRGNVIAEIGE